MAQNVRSPYIFLLLFFCPGGSGRSGGGGRGKGILQHCSVTPSCLPQKPILLHTPNRQYMGLGGWALFWAGEAAHGGGGGGGSGNQSCFPAVMVGWCSVCCIPKTYMRSQHKEADLLLAAHFNLYTSPRLPTYTSAAAAAVTIGKARHLTESGGSPPSYTHSPPPFSKRILGILLTGYLVWA